MTVAVPTAEVLIIDDATVDREGVEALVLRSSEFEVCAKVETPEQALTLAVQPAVVILGVVAGDPYDMTPIEVLRARFPGAAIVVLAHVIELEAVRSAIAAGVGGYLSKSVSPSELVRAVRAVAQGEQYLDPTIGVALATEGDRDRLPAALADLGRAEIEVLRQIALGHTNAEIANMLANSLRTIETHRAHIQRKLNAHSRAELVRVALDSGLVVPARHEHGEA